MLSPRKIASQVWMSPCFSADIDVISQLPCGRAFADASQPFSLRRTRQYFLLAAVAAASQDFAAIDRYLMRADELPPPALAAFWLPLATPWIAFIAAATAPLPA